MYIKNVHIENFRNFHCIDIPLKKLAIVIGGNDAGMGSWCGDFGTFYDKIRWGTDDRNSISGRHW